MNLKYILFFFTLLTHTLTFAQGVIKGTILDQKDRPVEGALIEVKGTKLFTTTDVNGEYRIDQVPEGEYYIIISQNGTAKIIEGIKVGKGMNKLDDTPVEVRESTQNTSSNENVPVVMLSEDELKGSGSPSVSSMLTSSRDVFVQAALFSFTSARFRLRGYDNENYATFMNGVPMDDLVTGRTEFYTWSGLNDVMRSRESNLGLAATTYTFGRPGGTFYIDSRASRQRKQLSASYSVTNRSYRNRAMLTWGSGLLKGGWAFALSYSRRWAQEGYIPGTFYDGHSYFAAAEKLIGDKHSLSLTVFGSANKNGRASAAIQEMYDLSGTNYYNPNWGYQNGEKRNASVARGHQPVAIFSHDWKIDEKSTLVSGFSATMGTRKVSGLDWFNAMDPRPDFYRRLPSFDPYYGDNPEAYEQLKNEKLQLMQGNEQELQIKWDELYEANAMNDTTVFGLKGKLAKYIVADRVTDNKQIGINTIYNRTINDHVTFNGGATYQLHIARNYAQVRDLMGADYYIDINQFALQDSPINNYYQQNNLDNPNRNLKEGDRYSYEYDAHVQRGQVWAQGVYKFNHIDLFTSAELSQTAFHRYGYNRSGLFLLDSYGRSSNLIFNNYALKAGITYKYNGRNYLYLNGITMSRAPYFDNVFVSPRTRNNHIQGVKSETINSLEASYVLKAPRLKARAGGFYTTFDNGTDNKSFYHEEYRTFVNYTLTNINKDFSGIEAAMDAYIWQGISATAVVSAGQYIYSSRPLATITQDNKDTVLATNVEVYARNLRVAGPQTAASFGLSYRSKKFWFINTNINFFQDIYYDFNPSRRTATSIDLIDEGTDKYNAILSQQKAPNQYTIDVFGGWSWKINNKVKSLQRNTFLVINVGIYNILDNQDLINGAFEQLRFDTFDKNINKFPPKNFYALGRNYFINMVLRLN